MQRRWWTAVAAASVAIACSSEDQTVAAGGATPQGSGGAGATSAGGQGGASSNAGGAGAASAGGANAGGANVGGTSAGGANAAGNGSGGGNGGVDFTYDPNEGGSGGSGGAESCAASEVLAEKKPVDIIVAIDNSGSMGEESAEVRDNINGSFADVLGTAGLDYRVVVISRVGNTGQAVCVVPPLGGPNCDNNPPIFRRVPRNVASTDALVRILCTFDGIAGPIPAGQAAYSCSGDSSLDMKWSNFLRTEAFKAFVVITDDNGGAIPAFTPTSGNGSLDDAKYFDAALLEKPGGQFGTAANRNYTFYGIFGRDNTAGSPWATCPPSGGVCSVGGNNGVNNGGVYQCLIAGVLGHASDHNDESCAADYSPVFQAIASNVAKGLACEFKLPVNDPMGQAIDPDEVTVKFVDSLGTETPFDRVTDLGACTGNEWYYDDNLNPTKILLCPAACTLVQADPEGQVKINVGCLQG